VCDRGSTFAGPGVCMTGQHLLVNVVCNTGSSVRPTSAVYMAGKTFAGNVVCMAGGAPECCMHDRRSLAKYAVCLTAGVLLQDLMYA